MRKSIFNRMLSSLAVAILPLAVLAGCTTAGQKSMKYSIAEADPMKGIVIGTVFERAAFTPRGAYFYLKSSGNKRIVLESGGGCGKPAIVNQPPKVPKGVGSTFAMQLPPRK